MTLPLWVSVPLIVILVVVFILNVHRGLTTGTIWVKNTKYDRADEPIFFWVSIVIYTTVILFLIGGLAIAFWALSG